MTATLPKNVADVYPLSPLQEGILFHSLYAPGSGVYFEQVLYEIEPAVSADIFQAAWQRIVDRHSALRCAFVWDGLKRPVQVVRSEVEVPLEHLDWRELGARERDLELERYLTEQRAGGFELTKAPLLRFTLIEWEEGRQRLVWGFHHLVLDGWSLPLILNELERTYSALAASQEPELPPAIPYRRYIDWLARQDRGAAAEAWRGDLAGFTAPTPLGVDRRTQTAGVDARRIDFTDAQTTTLLTFCRERRVTPNTLVQAAWAVLLRRYSGYRDIVFGATVSGRPPDLPGVESTVGMFINTLPVRVLVPDDAVVGPWLAELQLRQMELRQFEYSSLTEIHGWSDVPRDLPLFESILVFENYPPASTNGDSAMSFTVVGAFEYTGYPLTLVAAVAPCVTLIARFERDRFDGATIDRLLEHMKSILLGMADSPDARLDHLDILAPGERRQLLETWNDTATPFPRDRCYHELFEEQVARAPGATAIVDGANRVSYGKLNGRANQLAHELRSRGVRPGVLVGIFTEHSVEMLVGLLAILKAGGAYLPLDPDHPAERLAFMLDDTAAPIVLTQERLSARLPSTSAATLCLDRDWGALEHRPTTNPEQLARPDDLAYVIYTSGSTGRPKGVMIHHRGLNNYLVWAIEGYGLGGASGAPMLGSIAFDLSIPNFFLPLIGGRDVTLLPKDETLEHLSGLLQEPHDFSLMKITPSHLDVLRAQLPAECRLDSVRTYVVGADEVKAETVVAWRRLAPGARIIDEYGPTETVVGCSTYVVPKDQRAGTAVSIGKPIANIRMYVLDERLEPVPVGAVGELYIGGEGVARGYLGRPGLTAERFGPDPFSPEPGARVYRTGDFARFRPDGNLDFLGRIDHQVKIRGYRVELGEIEAMLLARPEVREAVVALREDVPGDKRLVAYVVASEGAAVVVAEVRSYLGDRLPPYMVPSAFVVLGTLPLSAGGKVDRRLLPRPDASATERVVDYVPPRTQAERRVTEIFAEVLGRPNVGVHDNFFHLGGHSLLATQVISRVREAFEADVPLRAVFEAPTPAQLAAVASAETTVRAGTPLEPISRQGELPLSFAQQRLWFLAQLEPESTFYNSPVGWRLRGPLDVPALRWALQEIVDRHEILRTGFVSDDGAPRQVILEHVELPFETVDLTQAPERERAARSAAADEAAAPFDLAVAPLLRAKLLLLDPDDHVLLLTLHHMVFDGWSLGVLVEELNELCAARFAGEPPKLDPLPIQYADFGAWQRRWLEGPELKRQLAYWHKQLADIPTLLELRHDRPRPPAQTFDGAYLAFELPVQLSTDLAALSRARSATLFMTLLAAFQGLLARYTGQTDVVLGTPVAGRTRREAEQLIGLFVNTLVLRTDLSGDPSFGELVDRVKATALDAYAHQDIPFERLVEELRPERSLAHTPLFQVNFGVHNARETALRLPRVGAEEFEVEFAQTKYDLSLYITEREDRLVGSLGYSTDLFDRTTVERLVEHFERLLAGAVANPDRPLSELELLSARERRLLVQDWNETSRPYPSECCLHELVEQQVERTPGAAAVHFGGEQLTYEQLNERANQLAHELHARGVGPETLVAVCLKRSLALPIALLAVLKAGGAYVPLDPDYPPERLAQMLEDTDTQLLLTEHPLLARVPPSTAEAICLDALPASVRAHPTTNPEPLASPHNLAYVIYTSGSTGRPKGVCIEHGGVVNHVAYVRARHEIGAADRCLQLSSPSFHPSVREIFCCLSAGGTLVLPAAGAERDPEEVLHLLCEQRITCLLSIVPSMLVHIAAAAAERSDADLSSLRLLVVCGEGMQTAQASLVRARLGAEIVNHFGPTESIMLASDHELGADDDPSRALLAGRPAPNATLYVLDPQGRIAPIGIAGEIHIGGASIARGYQNAPALTAERFVPDPFGSVPGARLYRSGDLARYLASGELEFLGRDDHQLKIRGFRIESSDVEAALLRHPEIAEAAVVARRDERDEGQLVAYVTLSDESEPAPHELRAFLSDLLPDYMIPSAFVVLERMPLTPSGKVEREVLPGLRGTRIGPRAATLPRTLAEELVAVIWRDELAIERVSVEDDFFELGGHSLLAARVSVRLRRLGVDLPLRTLFEATRLADLAAAVERARSHAGAASASAWPPSLVPISTAGEGRPFFCVHEASGDVLAYVKLALRMGGTRPFVGIQPHAADDASRPLAEIGAVAEAYLERIRHVQPVGPYLLGGWSFGGVVAFEMASRLRERGESVDRLVLFDSYVPSPEHAAVVRARRLIMEDLEALIVRAADEHAWPPRAGRAELETRFAEVGLGGLVDRPAEDLIRLLRILEAHGEAIERYRPRPYPGTITLFVARGQSRSADIRAGWGRLAATLDSQEVPGDHLSLMMEPHVGELARRLDLVLGEADADLNRPVNAGVAST